jgi:CheY-like chemotaxis protein
MGINKTGKKKILLVDDEEDFCFFMKKNLENTNEFQVITVTEGQKGIALARKEMPDLILLDIIMPGISGIDMADTLLNDPETKQIPIIFLTAVVGEGEMCGEPIAEIGGRNFIAKTVGIKKITAFIKEVLEK